MPANSIFRRLLISAAGAAVFAVAAAAVPDKSDLKSTSENASAYVIFTEADADTGAEALRTQLSSVDMLILHSLDNRLDTLLSLHQPSICVVSSGKASPKSLSHQQPEYPLLVLTESQL